MRNLKEEQALLSEVITIFAGEQVEIMTFGHGNYYVKVQSISEKQIEGILSTGKLGNIVATEDKIEIRFSISEE